ncbi:MarR family transcriptional regulator, partial [Vibrio cholerae O1]|nr:MarR family transcriptional regulator [Vibrio cholerae O1]
MPSIDIDEDTSVETTTMTETPTLDLNAKVEIINFINTFDV